MSTLAEIRAKLQAQDSRTQQNQERSQSDNAMFPFWNMQEGTNATIRFLPDADNTNSFFWVERSLIRLPFNGVKGQTDNRQITVQVPCMEMYSESCPILAEVRTWYKDESLKETANKYWKKRTYLFQGFVRQNPLADDRTPENPIRRFVISPQIFTIIKSSLMDPEIEEMPTDYMRGLDFRITKTTKGGYADYSTSGWARKETALTEVERAAIDAHGLFNLREFLPKKPSDAESRIIREMFEASIDGRQYDPDKWAAYYKPYGLQFAGGNKEDATDQAPTTLPAKQANQSTPPWEDEQTESTPVKEVKEVKAAPVQGGSDKTQDILAMIRARQNKQA